MTRYAWLMMLCFAAHWLNAQLDSSSSKVQVIHADLFRFERLPGREIQYLSKDVLVKHKATYLLCDSAVIDSNQVIALGHVRIVEGDSLQVFGDSLFYDGDTRLAMLEGKVVLKHKDQQLFTDRLQYDLNNRISSYSSGGLLVSEQAKLRSKKGYYHASTGNAYFKDSVVVLMKDSMQLVSDTLLYQTREQKVVFIGPTLIHRDSLQIYTDTGYYDVKLQRSHFGNFPRYRKGDQRADAKNIYHDASNKKITLVGEAKVKDAQQYAKADSIIFNDTNGDVLLFEHAYYEEAGRILEGKQIKYNRRSKSLQVLGAPRVVEGGRTIQASVLKYDGTKDFGFAKEGVVVTDTSEAYTIVCDSFAYQKNTKRFNAVGIIRRPYIAVLFEGDSLYLAADSLFSERIISVNDSFQTIRAWGKVRIWNKQLRGLCDSLYFSGVDSTFYLFDQPVIWTDSSQLSGDTIRMVLQDHSLSDFYLSPNGFIINREHQVLDNQIKGRFIQGHFSEKKIRHMVVEGNAESVYFIQDAGKGYIGTNVIQCSSMKFVFNDDKKIDYIDFFTKPEGDILPFHAGRQKFIEGYKPRYEERPESLKAIIQWNLK